MKTKDVPAIVMLLAGGVYCLFGILYKIPLMEFLTNLLIILIVFWILGGIVKMVLDRFMGEIKVKEEEAENSKSKESESKESDSNESESDESDGDVEEDS